MSYPPPGVGWPPPPQQTPPPSHSQQPSPPAYPQQAYPPAYPQQAYPPAYPQQAYPPAYPQQPGGPAYPQQPYAQQPYPPFVPATPDPGGRRRTARFSTRALVVTGAVSGVLGLLVGGLTGAGLALDDGPLGGFGAGPPVDEVLAERLPELTRFVEVQVGAGFDAPPEVTVLDDAAFERRLFSSGGDQPQSLPEDDYTAKVTALGLVADADAYDEYMSSGFASSVTGFYDSGAKTLWVRGTEWTPTVEVTIVHELVHALQDQEVDLDALTASTHLEDETYLAFTALVEGQATVIEGAWVAEQGSEFEERYYAEGDELYAAAPSEPFGDEMGGLPYWMGHEAVTALPDSGHAALAAIKTPPKTIEQVWFIEDWQAGLPLAADPVAITEPAVPAGAEVVDRGMVGSYVLALLPVHPTKFVFYADGPVPGWAGDRYVTWNPADAGDERSCTAVDVRFDLPADADAYVTRMETWAAKGGTVTSNGATVTLTRCTA